MFRTFYFYFLNLLIGEFTYFSGVVACSLQVVVVKRKKYSVARCVNIGF